MIAHFRLGEAHQWRGLTALAGPGASKDRFSNTYPESVFVVDGFLFPGFTLPNGELRGC